MSDEYLLVARAADVLVPTDRGLLCPAGDFYIDPWRPVARAVVTHAHGDHIVAGCGGYVCSPTGAVVLRERLGAEAARGAIEPRAFGEAFELGGARVSLHPAGHILGSAQVRVEVGGAVWVVSGDYKTAADRTCEAFEPVACDVFITESTFGLPIYRWPDERAVFDQINAWWRANAAQGRTSLVFAYALGKAQRVLGGLDESIGPIAAHGAVRRMNEAYRAAGVSLAEARLATREVAAEIKGRGLVLAPPSALGSPWVRKFAASEGGMSAAFVSGWMLVRGTRRRKAVDRGFVLSDHADWDGLLAAIKATGARRVGVTHGYVGPLVRWLGERGAGGASVEAFSVPTRYQGERGEEAESGDDEARGDSEHAGAADEMGEGGTP